ncbi:MAG: M57 family metalloprotease [Myxococcota bacterium]
MGKIASAVLGALALSAIGGCDPGPAEADSSTEQIVANLLEAGHRPADIEITPEGEVLVQGDIRMSLEASAGPRGTSFRQFVTNVTVADSIDEIVIWVGPRLRSGSFLTAADEALKQWNGIEGSRLRFSLSTDCLPPASRTDRGVIEVTAMDSSSTCDAATPGDINRDVNGVADFPSSDGRPGATIEINPCLLAKSLRNQTSTLMHEIGHTVGFRHTDYATHSSCGGSRTDEGVPPYGAVQVPGTPDAAQGDPDSIMNACAPAEQSGTWSDADRHAIGIVYFRPSEG